MAAQSTRGPVLGHRDRASERHPVRPAAGALEALRLRGEDAGQNVCGPSLMPLHHSFLGCQKSMCGRNSLSGKRRFTQSRLPNVQVGVRWGLRLGL